MRQFFYFSSRQLEQVRHFFARAKAVLSLFAVALILFAATADSATAATPGQRQHLIFWKGTPQELEVFRIYGRNPGPTALIVGGIHGNEPGGYLGADLYSDVSLKTGNLIVVPRSNFRAVILDKRGDSGDMNRKFGEELPGDLELNVVNTLKSLMAESDLFLHLHDGSGFYRPRWEDRTANHYKLGQSIIVDTDVYIRETDGRALDLKTPAEEVIARLNKEISEPLYKFHLFNMDTVQADTRHPEQRMSATYYALTQLGVPAFCIEVSKELPSLEMKVRQHVIAVNAFLDIFGIELEYPGITLAKPILGYVIIAVNDSPPIAVGAGQTLVLSPGDTIEVLHVNANYERGLSVVIEGLGGQNDINRPVKIEKPTTLAVRRDNAIIGEITVSLFSEGEKGPSPKLLGENRARPPRQPIVATLDMLPGTQIVIAAKAEAPAPAKADAHAAPVTQTVPASVTIRFQGESRTLPFGRRIAIPVGAEVELESVALPGNAPADNLRFTLAGRPLPSTIPQTLTMRDIAINLRVFNGEVEVGKITWVPQAAPAPTPPAQASVTIRFQDGSRTLPLGSRGSRVAIPVGATVELERVVLPGNAPHDNLRLTLAGHPLPSTIPQTLTMRDIAINLRVFDGEVEVGKVTWVPR